MVNLFLFELNLTIISYKPTATEELSPSIVLDLEAKSRITPGRNTFGTFLGGNGTENTPDVFRHDNCEQLGT
jgi:hypothetical protein